MVTNHLYEIITINHYNKDTIVLEYNILLEFKSQMKSFNLKDIIDIVRRYILVA